LVVFVDWQGLTERVHFA